MYTFKACGKAVKYCSILTSLNSQYAIIAYVSYTLFWCNQTYVYTNNNKDCNRVVAEHAVPWIFMQKFSDTALQSSNTIMRLKYATE